MKNEEWDILMKESPTATWFQSEEAWNFFCSCAEWMTAFHTEVRRGEELVGIVTGYITKENSWKQRFSCRAVINGGPLLRADATIAEVRELLETTEAEVKRLSNGQIIYIETRNFVAFSPWKEAFEQAGWEYQPHYDIHVDCSDAEAMWERFHESKKRALKTMDSRFFVRADSTSSETDAPCVAPPTPTDPSAGTQLFLRKSVCAPLSPNGLGCPTDIDQWYSLLEELYKKKVHRPLWPQAFFERAIESGVGKLLVVHDAQCTMHNEGVEEEGGRGVGKVIGGMFVVEDEKRVYEWYVVGSVMATYAGLQYAAQHKKQIFDFMGAGEPEKPYGVRDFKMQFGGELKELGRWIRVCKRGYYNFGKFIVNANILG